MSGSRNNTMGITTIPASSLPAQTWWPRLHEIIIEAFLHKPENAKVFPPDWKRLPGDPATAAQSLADELGERGHFAVVFEDEQPIACGGILPYRGAGWVNQADSGKSDADIANCNSSSASQNEAAEWEVCCFCVSPTSRGQGVSRHLLEYLENFIKDQGAQRLYSSYAEIETGTFWPRMGFEVIPGAGGVLKKGFKVHPEKEGLREDVVFSMAVKTLQP